MSPLISTFVQRAFSGAEALPPSNRADLYEAAAELLKTISPPQAEMAARTAAALREAEQLQLHFRNLFADSDPDSEF